MTGFSKKISSMKVGVCVYFELAKDQFGQSQATSTKSVKYEQKQIAQSKVICALMVISTKFNNISRLSLCLPPHICMETTFG